MKFSAIFIRYLADFLNEGLPTCSPCTLELRRAACLSVGMHVLQLSPSHIWKAAPGCRILVVDNGALRFDFPRDWMVFSPGKHVFIIDQPPPDNRCLIAVSCRRVSSDVMAIPLLHLLEEWARSDDRSVIHRIEPIRFCRWPLEVAWLEMRVADPERRREISSRVCVARADSTHALFTCDSPADDEQTIRQIWNTLLETLTVGEYIDDPATGRKRIKRG